MATDDLVRDDYLRLRTIMLSGRNALDKTDDLREQARIRARMVELMGALEGSIRRDGADPDMLSLIRHMRGELQA